MSTAIGLSSVPSARYGPTGCLGSGVTLEVEPGGSGGIDCAVDPDRVVEALRAVLEARDREPAVAPPPLRPADRTGRGRDRDRAERADEDEDRDDDRQQALAAGEPGPERVRGAGLETEPGRDALALGQAMRPVGEDRPRRWRVEGAEPSDC